MLDILQKLVEIPSVTEDYQHNHQAIEFIDGFLRSRGMHVKRLEFGGVESLIATTQRTKTPRVYLQAHVDVSPAPAGLYTVRQDKDKLYGRGVFDMKFAIATYLQLVDDLKDHLDRYDFGIMITSDEEYGGENGAQSLIANGYVPTKICVIPDGGDNWAIESFAKGLWFLRLTMPGTAAHGSRPWEGDSALEKLLLLIGELRQSFPHNSREERTMTVGVLHAGQSVNQIPAEASADIDIRTTTFAEHQEVFNLVTALCKKHGATMHVITKGTPCINDVDDPYYKLFIASIEATTKRPVSATMSFAGSDGRHFSEAGVLCAIVRPDGGGHHSDSEWISKEGFYQLLDVLRHYIDTATLKTAEPEHQRDYARTT
jgi:succinyl-diaminopimelate desuccinylase